MAEWFLKLRLLLWKNFLQKRRNWKIFLIELIVPLFIATIFLILRHTVKSQTYDEDTIYTPYRIYELPKTLTRPDGKPWMKLAYTPSKFPQIDAVMDKASRSLGLEGKAFDSEETFIRQNIDTGSKANMQYLGLIVFDSLSNGQFTNNIKFKVRMSPTPYNYKHYYPGAFRKAALQKWSTDKQYPLFQLPTPRNKDGTWGGPPGYMAEGFLTIQHAVSSAIISNLSSIEDIPPVKMQRYPYPPYVEDVFLVAMQQFFPIFIIFSYAYAFVNISKDIVYEKEKRLKESMKVMGLDNWFHWLAWFIKDFAILFFSTIILIILIAQIFPKSSPFVMLLFFTAIIINVICFSFLLSVFFSKANTIAAGSGGLFLATYMPFLFVSTRYETLSLAQKLSMSLLGNTALSFGGQIVVMLEGSGSGVQFNNFYLPASPDDSLTLLQIIIMLLFDSFLYFFLTWYIEAVFPGEFGLAQPFYFPFLPSYWCRTKCHDVIDPESISDTSKQNPFVEDNPIGLKAGISIQGLTKVYNSKTVAVKELFLNMYKNHITALLGHNGAGKTTTMAMLTGMYPPTRGTAFIDDYDIRTNIADIRKSLGFCPQHDILFDDLTVEEHLHFFCKLKGFKGDAIVKEIDAMLGILNLEDKRKALSKTLSGGMKRKLSVGIALCANSKIVMLDEPTSGMDPAARRSTWDLLNEMKRDRTILLTTHFMEEADVLGDRIAILSSGELQCCGSSMFLKKKYGAGYHLVLVKENHCDVEKVTSLVTQFVPTADLESNMGAELSFVLPHESSSKFETLFQEIEDNKDTLGISGYGASITTMEEVFIKVGEKMETGESTASHLISNQGYKSLSDSVNSIEAGSTTSYDMNNKSRNKGLKLIFQQVYGLLMKKVIYTLRNKRLILFQLAVPVLLLILALLVVKSTPKVTDSPSLTLKLDSFDGSKIPVADFNSNTSTEAAKIAEIYKKQFASSSVNEIIGIPADNSTDYSRNLAAKGEEDISKFSLHWIVGATFSQNTTGEMGLTAFFNNQPYHAAPISLALLQSALLKFFLNESDYSFTVINYPLPRTSDIIALQKASFGRDGYQISQNLMFGLIFLSASFLVFLVQERTVCFKHLQVVSGVNLITFWVTTFVWDFINYIIPCVLMLLMFFVFNEQDYTSPPVQGALYVLMIVHGFGVLPLVYSLSFIFSAPATAYSRTILIMLLLGIASLLSVNILEIPTIGEVDTSKTLDWVFSFLPMYSVGRGVYKINQNYQYLELCDQFFDAIHHMPPGVHDRKEMCEYFVEQNIIVPCCPETCTSPDDYCLAYSNNYFAWELPGVGRYLTFLSIDFVAFLLLLFAIENHLFRRLKYLLRFRKTVNPSNEDNVVPFDDDVEREKERILKTPLRELFKSDMLIFRDLTKNYGSLQAVNHLSLGIERGECFGLLGVNGAGKTSTFKMITGDESVSDGSAFLEGFSIKDEISKVQQRLGYCPQFDALMDQFTGAEILRLFARLRGVPEHRISSVIKHLSEDLIFEKHLNKLVNNYSGGNKRKLSTAIALIGDSPIIFLDEPTAGIDPIARRLMWKTICDVKNSGRSILLTSHSMEECEALCGRLVIMVNGRFCCLGSPQHLKSKFSEGYTVLVKLKADAVEGGGSIRSTSFSERRPPSVVYMRSLSRTGDVNQDKANKFTQFFMEMFPRAALKSMHQLFFHYHIPLDPSVRWAKIFGTMEKAKNRFDIEDYTVSQTSLEQVFLQFAALQISVDD